MARFISLLFGALLVAFALWFYLRPKPESADIASAPTAQTTTTPPPAADKAAQVAPATTASTPEAPKSAHLAAKWAELTAATDQARALGVAKAAAWLRDDTALTPEDHTTLRAFLVANLPEAIGEVVRAQQTDLAWSFLGTLKFLAPEDQDAYNRAIQIWGDALASTWAEILKRYNGQEPQMALAEMDLIWLYPASEDMVVIFQTACIRRARQYAEANPELSVDWLTEAATARPMEGGPLLEYLEQSTWTVKALEQAGLRLIASGRAELAVPFLQAAIARAQQAAPAWGYTGTPEAETIRNRLTHNLARAWIASGDALRIEKRILRTTMLDVACYERARELLPEDPQIRELVDQRLTPTPVQS